MANAAATETLKGRNSAKRRCFGEILTLSQRAPESGRSSGKSTRSCSSAVSMRTLLKASGKAMSESHGLMVVYCVKDSSIATGKAKNKT